MRFWRAAICNTVSLLIRTHFMSFKAVECRLRRESEAMLMQAKCRMRFFKGSVAAFVRSLDRASGRRVLFLSDLFGLQPSLVLWGSAHRAET